MLNLICNGTIIYLTAHFMKWHLSRMRLCISTIFASSYLLLLWIGNDSMSHHFLSKLIFSFAILFIAFGRKMKNRLWTTLITFYGLYMVTGGSLYVLYSFIYETSIFSPTVTKVSMQYVLGTFPIVALATKKQVDYVIRKKYRMNMFYDVSLQTEGKVFQLIGFVDTGNQLYDPLTNRPVIFASRHVFEQMWTIEEWAAIEMAVSCNDLGLLPRDIRSQFTTIPFVDVAGNEKLIHAQRIQQVSMTNGEEQKTSKQVLLGIHLGKLTPDNSYDCLLHPALVYDGKM